MCRLISSTQSLEAIDGEIDQQIPVVALLVRSGMAALLSRLRIVEVLSRCNFAAPREMMLKSRKEDIFVGFIRHPPECSSLRDRDGGRRLEFNAVRLVVYRAQVLDRVQGLAIGVVRHLKFLQLGPRRFLPVRRLAL